MNEQKQRTASERIEDLENAMRGLFQSIEAMANEMGALKNAIRLINGKTDAIMKAANASSGITEASVTEQMIAANVAELKAKVDNMIAQGVLEAEQTVTASSFVVGQEVESNGTVANPRLQFSMNALPEEIKSKIVGTAVGQTATFEEGKLGLTVLESYSVVVPKAPEAEAPAETAPEAVNA